MSDDLQKPPQSEIPRIRYDDDDDDGGDKPTMLHKLAQRSLEKPFLLVVGGDASVGRYCAIESGMVIGRSVGADIVLSEEGVSRRHARVAVLPDGGFHFVDLGSSNGMRCKGARVVSQVLREGERIQIGEAILVPLHIKDAGANFQRNLFASATEDPTSRLAERGFFTAMAERECSLAARYGVPLSLTVIAVDQYHALIKAHGAALGIILLKSIGHIAKRRAPPGVLVARHGVDQLAVLLPETTAASALTWASSVLAAASSVNFEFTSHSIDVTISAGVAAMGEEGVTSLRELTARAGGRLARSKVEGGSKVTAT